MKTETLLTLAIVGAAAVFGYFMLRPKGATMTTPQSDYSGSGDDAMWGAVLGLGQVAGQAFGAYENAQVQKDYIDYLNYSTAVNQ